MTELETTLQESGEDLSRIGAADVVLAIPTYNNRETVGAVLESGLEALLGRNGLRPVIVNADGASKDGTPEFVREMVGSRVPLIQVRYPVYPVHKLTAPLAGVPGRGEALDAVFAVSRKLGAKVCTVLDADLKSVNADWVERLTTPVLNNGIDIVAPFYLRHKFDGMINAGIVYPFTRALYGKRVRQALGADLAFSARLMDFYANHERPDGAQPAIDPWSVVPAICGGFEPGQTFLGPRVVDNREVTPDLSVTLRLVLGGLFDQMESTVAFWQKVRGSEPVPWFGPPLEVNDEPAQVNVKRMRDSFKLGLHDLQEIWAKVLPPATFFELRKMSRMPEESFCFPDEVWARTVYDFALGYHVRAIGRDHLLQAMTPLYLGWVASFVNDLQAANQAEVEDRLERLATQFDVQKRYLISRWRSPDKFNP